MCIYIYLNKINKRILKLTNNIIIINLKLKFKQLIFNE